MDGFSGPLPQALLAQSGWARRLARQLVSEAQADDLVQDALVAGLHHPPATDRPLRGWLATVMRNLAHNRRAAERRRQAREQVVPGAESTPPTAEETLATVQLHRQLARLVERLPPEERRIVVFHYLEERSSTAIGQLLGLPAATVRWRLGRALDQLRAWLDEEAGGSRRKWLLAMAPLLRLPAALPAALPATAVTGLTLASVLLIATVAAVVLRPHQRRLAEAPDAPPPPMTGGRTPAFTSGSGGKATAPAAIPATSCPTAVAGARSERLAIEQDLLQFEDPAVYFDHAASSRPNQELFTPLLTELLGAEFGGVLECREGICRVLLVRSPEEDWGPVRSGLFDRSWHQRVKAHVTRIDSGKIGGITRDPLSGQLQQKYGLYLRLPPPAPPPAMPAGATCEQERARLQALLPELRQRQQRAVPPPVRFVRAREINGRATAQIRAWLERQAGGKAGALEVECREDICRIHPVAPWLSALQHRPEWNERLSGGFRGPDGALYHRIRTPRPRTEQEIMGDLVWRKAASAVQAAIQRCAERHASADRVDLTILFPGPGELNADGLAGKPSLRLAGPSAEQPFGGCLRDGVTSALASLPVPPGSPGREIRYSVRGTLPAP